MVSPSALAARPMRWTDLVSARPPRIHRIGPVTGPIAAAVAQLEGVLGRPGGSAARLVPSAGAIYPYEILLTTADHGVFASVDLARRQVLVRHGDEFRSAAGEFGFLLVGRPWLSMRKYGSRGYLYHLIDSGHALLNLALLETTAAAPGLAHIHTASLHDALAVGHLVLGRSVPDPLPRWRMVVTADTTVQTGRTAYEEWANRLIPEGPSRPVRVDNVADRAWALRRLLPARRSTRAFGPGPTPGLADALHDGFDWAAMVLSHFRLPMPKTHIVDPGRARPALSDDELLAGLGGQEHLRHAGAFVVIGAPASPSEHIDDERKKLMLAAGVLGQALYLAATEHGVAVTGVGGIDPAYWRRFLSAGAQPLYLVALGTAADDAIGKVDALSQGSHE
ncbi:hypothetical protein FMUBM48_30630 [Nocardia cyriacigeorgica]|nr:hypothetical protein FMUBM48_30630 [Nocardia cyriacigeorgica]